MSIEEMIKLLISDLSNENAHMHFYLEAATNLKGFHRHELAEFFEEQAASEMKHVLEFRKLIQGLITRRGIGRLIPFHVSDFARGLSSPGDLLLAALHMEEVVVENYVVRHAQAEALAANGGADAADGTYVALFLEDQILDSRSDADEIRQMLANSY